MFSSRWRGEEVVTFLMGRSQMKRFAPVQNNLWVLLAIGTSLAHSSSSFSVRFTRVLTGYFFINLGSNDLRQSVTAAASLIPGSTGQPKVVVFRLQDRWHTIMDIGYVECRVLSISDDGLLRELESILLFGAFEHPSLSLSGFNG